MPIVLNPLERFLFLTLNQAPAPLLDMNGSAALPVVVAAIQLNIFETLAEQPATAEALARQLNLDPRGAVCLLGTLAALGYVESRGGKFALKPMARKWLTNAGRANLSPFLRFWGALQENFYPKLADSIRTGQPPIHLYEWLETHPEVSNYFQEGLRALAQLFLEGIVNAITVPPRACRVLDLGGGHALYSIALCQKYPQLSAVVYDSAQALVVGRATLDTAQLNERVQVHEGDFMHDALGTNFDLVLLFNILHGFRAQDNITLLQNVKAALNPGGRVVIVDQLVGKGGTPIAETLTQILGISFFLLVGGQTYTYDEMHHWLTSAGFDNIQLKRSLKTGTLLFADSPQ
jgi:SAM-dependent methyltransferase